MKPSETINCIDCMYKGLPFRDESGNLIYVSDRFDCLLNSCELFDRSLFKLNSFTTTQYEWFLKNTLTAMFDIDFQEFKERTKSVDQSTREILLRTIGRLVQQYPDVDFSQYTIPLVS